ncbi:MAG TPA: hypothetical protein VEL28_05895 [Candidatus Binatia bacterium]|nr:hypothetical protein [Candidatus Binatia bacterium]
MKRDFLSFEVFSVLRAPAEKVWAHAISLDGVNAELAPIARMTAPPGASLDPSHVVLGQRLFRSWILAFGVLPIDYDDITLIELEPGRRFLERSPMLSQAMWEHERVIEPQGSESCTVRDRVRFRPRLWLLGRMQKPLFHLTFINRHRNLRRMFGRR